MSRHNANQALILCSPFDSLHAMLNLTLAINTPVNASNAPKDIPINKPSLPAEYHVTQADIEATFIRGYQAAWQNSSIAALGYLLAHLEHRADIQPLFWHPVTSSEPIPPHAIPCHTGDKLLGHLVAPTGEETAKLLPWMSWFTTWLTMHTQQAQLLHAAYTDPLTGAWNRRYITRFLEHAIAQADQQNSSLTLVYLDIDNFNQFNDQFGHHAGDDILCQTVQLLQSVIRKDDRVARIGGDEFVIVFPQIEPSRRVNSEPPRDALAITERFQRELAKKRFPKLTEQLVGTLTISAGLASYPQDANNMDDLLAHADQKTLHSKRSGKNAITFGANA